MKHLTNSRVTRSRQRSLILKEHVMKMADPGGRVNELEIS